MIVKALFDGLDYYEVLLKTKVHEKQIFRKQLSEEIIRLASEVNNEKMRKDYNQKVTKKLSGICDDTKYVEVKGVVRIFNGKILGAVEQVISTKPVTVRKIKRKCMAGR